MANQTTNYKLTKPLPEEFYDVEVFNGNMDIVDAELKNRATLKNGKVPTTQLPIGTANGVAGLDASGKVATDKLPIGTANGVAGLDASGKIPAESFPEDVGGGSGKRTVRFTVGNSQYGWTDKDCDYLCDGTADEVEINAAIQALRSTGGEIVLLDGQYNLTGSIIVDFNNITIRGNGNNTKLKRGWMGVYESIGMIKITSDYCTVKDLYLDGVKGSYNDYYQNGVYIDDFSQNCRVEGCMFVYHGGKAVDLGGKYSIVINNHFENNDTGVETSYGDHNVITANVFFTNEYCIQLGSDGNVVTNNTMKTTTYYAIDLSSSANNTIVGNVSDGAKSGLYASYGTNSTIVGNTFLNGTKYGIELSTGSSGNTIAGNVCVGNTSGEVYMSVADNKQYAPLYTKSTTDITAGSTALANDELYLVYE